jgi:rhodanese-related sulfurtransferase
MKLGVVVLPVRHVDHAKAFYRSAGFREDVDYASGDDFRVVQFTPPGSEASIVFGRGITSAPPGSVHGLLLAVADIEAARAELLVRGVDVGEVFHDLGGVFYRLSPAHEVPGPDPARRDYASFARFCDPDGNGWLIQEVSAGAAPVAPRRRPEHGAAGLGEMIQQISRAAMAGRATGAMMTLTMDRPRAEAALGTEPIRTIGRPELKAKLDRGDEFRLIMALNRWAFDAKHIPGSVHFDTPDELYAAVQPDEDVVVYCSHVDCLSSVALYRDLVRRGYRNVQRYSGGLLDWEDAGLPVEGEFATPP